MMDGWPNLTPGRSLLLALALGALVYLLWQTRTPPVQISGWSGPQLGAALQQVSSDVQAPAAPFTGRGLPGADDGPPRGNPLRLDSTVLTQGYGVGSHAPAEVWGGVDMAIDGDGDGHADPQGTLGMPIYATHAGVARVKPDTWPAGNYLAVEGAGYKTAYAHLQRYAVEDGQQVARGQIIGYVGSTGQSSGPHLHYEVWKDGVNVNPLDYGALDGAGR